jgi:predicted enzyme related to lactoylglutathione lyase
MKPQGFKMAWVLVDNLAQGKEFFSKTLGLTMVADSPEYNWAEFSAGDDTHIGIGEACKDTPMKAGSNAVICINVADIIAAKSELESKNVRILGDIQEVPGHVKMILIQDPSGNLYNIVQKLY